MGGLWDGRKILVRMSVIEGEDDRRMSEWKMWIGGLIEELKDGWMCVGWIVWMNNRV